MVAATASRLAGRRGISNRGLAVMTAFLVAYGLVRFVWLAPNGLWMSNASGYFFERLEAGKSGVGLARDCRAG